MKTKFRPYDELKKEFEALNMKVQTDHEIMSDLLKQLNTTDNNANRVTILTDLEYYLHQVRRRLSQWLTAYHQSLSFAV